MHAHTGFRSADQNKAFSFIVSTTRLPSFLLTFVLHRNFRTAFKGWRSTSGGGGGGIQQYSNRWWFWTHKGRILWRQCKEKGESSPFWAENKCSTRIRPAKGTKYWWWSITGRAVWKQCKEKGETSPFWKDNDCDGGRSVACAQ